ncbi:Nucleotide-binding universal stress protein, UspA family [Halogranum gelatinilyticum]|uniref:Nucleotide-binding universal stress protein, UspA family n=1 Tax=Halogranum gelatinilyticum TaxID=660521 RepID=A0A1G9XD30_9EURY|nr:Nucleotide-binding universal stress protein, UspA family [Halogranum gelatinilyticum]
MYSTILVPAGGSETATRAVDYAIDFDRQYNATLHALSIVEVGELGLRTPTDVNPAKLRRPLRERAQNAGDAVARVGEKASVDVVEAIRVGVTHQEILEYAADNNVDLVRIHGWSGLPRAFLKIVTERVVWTSNVPVLVGIHPTNHPTVDRQRQNSDNCTRDCLYPHLSPAGWCLYLISRTDNTPKCLFHLGVDPRTTRFVSSVDTSLTHSATSGTPTWRNSPTSTTSVRSSSRYSIVPPKPVTGTIPSAGMCCGIALQSTLPTPEATAHTNAVATSEPTVPIAASNTVAAMTSCVERLKTRILASMNPALTLAENTVQTMKSSRAARRTVHWNHPRDWTTTRSNCVTGPRGTATAAGGSDADGSIGASGIRLSTSRPESNSVESNEGTTNVW